MRSLLPFVLVSVLTPAATLLAQCPASGSCFVSHATPGCNDPDCCEVVCDIDPFCCDVAWDSICAGEAADACGCGAPEAGSCFIQHNTPWCNDPECCDAVCAQDGFCCTVQWDDICGGEALSICAGCGGVSTGDCFEVGISGCSDEACCKAVCAIDDYCCQINWDELCVIEAFENCTLCGEPTAGSCTESHGTPACDDITCCSVVCVQDPFCCEVVWDFLCVSGALALCNFCTGDFDANGQVDAGDLANLLASWGFQGYTDLNDDGITGSADLSILLGAWGVCP
jgi:hypothetical protein